jgi:hypothetical protein
VPAGCSVETIRRHFFSPETSKSYLYLFRVVGNRGNNGDNLQNMSDQDEDDHYFEYEVLPSLYFKIQVKALIFQRITMTLLFAGGRFRKHLLTTGQCQYLFYMSSN